MPSTRTVLKAATLQLWSAELEQNFTGTAAYTQECLALVEFFDDFLGAISFSVVAALPATTSSAWLMAMMMQVVTRAAKVNAATWHEQQNNCG